ncbi:DUF2141 domain-containing protein [Algoriphagus sp. AGSA1]|uniref:DUF2141 domain-containing protein n=1 Tax=Algoriphagus sp. AGSA1 TaxID=2907213 RepID=UPI001F263327|nr:DUF2141 domain-containing protein [Algoriphagus sp. AGSA1]MCE7057001.1 DUF2141 domain-containing protein [Algoriphagus sp. AGSA1]
MKLAIFSLFLLLASTQDQRDSGTIEISISETSSEEGVVQVLIFNKDDGWPESLDKAWKMLTIPIENKVARKTIADVPPGNYAVTVFHDHDEDGKIRKNKVGYPLDSFGFSNNPSLLFGVPSFSKCSKKVNPAVTTQFDIELR